jgi:hypothetical protein
MRLVHAIKEVLLFKKTGRQNIMTVANYKIL